MAHWAARGIGRHVHALEHDNPPDLGVKARWRRVQESDHPRQRAATMGLVDDREEDILRLPTYEQLEHRQYLVGGRV